MAESADRKEPIYVTINATGLGRFFIKVNPDAPISKIIDDIRKEKNITGFSLKNEYGELLDKAVTPRQLGIKNGTRLQMTYAKQELAEKGIRSILRSVHEV